MKLNAKIRRKINNKLHKLGLTYHDSIPLADIQDVLIENGLDLLDDDGTPWSGLLCGTDVHTDFHMGVWMNACSHEPRELVTNSFLCLSWHKMPSGRYEIVAYAS